MKSAVKTILIIASCLLIVGAVIVCCVMASFDWDFHIIANKRLVTNTYDITEDFESVLIISNTEDIYLYPSEDDNTKVVISADKDEPFTVSVSNNSLLIQYKDLSQLNKRFRLFSSINASIKVYLPKAEYTSLTIGESTGDVFIPDNFVFSDLNIVISTGDIVCSASATNSLQVIGSTGDITIKSLSSRDINLNISTGNIIAQSIDCEGDIKLKVSTGKTLLENVTCNNLISNGSTGDVILRNVITKENININRSTGDVELINCDANELLIKTTTGDVDGLLLTDKIVFANSDTGKIKVPNCTSGGKCSVTTKTGDIKIEIVK